jgi:hypothetical protein
MKRVIAAVVLCGAVLGSTATAHADGLLSRSESDWVSSYGAAVVCPVLADYPSAGGVLGVGEFLIEQGFAPDSAADIVNASVSAYCPEYWPLLQFVGEQARRQGSELA